MQKLKEGKLLKLVECQTSYTNDFHNNHDYSTEITLVKDIQYLQVTKFISQFFVFILLKHLTKLNPPPFFFFFWPHCPA